MSDKKDKILTLRVPEEIHRPARMRAADLDVSFQTVLLELLTKWSVEEAPKPALSTEDFERVRALIRILQSPDEPLRKTLILSLDSYLEKEQQSNEETAIEGDVHQGKLRKGRNKAS